MNNQEYEQKKRECWEEFKEKHFNGNAPWSPYGAFDFAFDRAFALGKEKETISQKEIEKASVEFADREYEIGQVDWDALYKGYSHGMKDSLGKQEKNADTVISGWVARDSNESLYLFCLKPERVRYLGSSDGVWMSRTIEKLDLTLFPDLTWESDPLEVELIIKRKKNG